MKPVQIGTVLKQTDETTAIYEKYPEWFEVRTEHEWLVKYIVSREPSEDLIADIEAYYAVVKERNRKHDDFVDRVAKDVLEKLNDKEKEYIFLHPDSTTHHFGLGLWVRNNYIHGKELDFECWHPDNLSSEIMDRVASLLISNYDYENPFYRYLYDDDSFNRLRRLYFAVRGEYPDALMDQFAGRPDERQAAKEAKAKLRKAVLSKQRFHKLCRKYGLSEEQYHQMIEAIDAHNKTNRTIAPYDIGLLASRKLEPEFRKNLICLLRTTLEPMSSQLAIDLPIFMFDQKDAVLVAVRAEGKSLKRFPKFKSDDDVIRAALTDDGEAIQYVRKDLRDNPDYIRIALSNKYSAALKTRCMAKYRDNVDIVRIALEANGRNIEFASDRLKDDLETARFAVTHQKNWYPESTVCNLSPRLRDTLEIALLDIREGHACVRSYSERLRDSEEVAEALIESGNTWGLHCMSKRIQEKYKDKEQS